MVDIFKKTLGSDPELGIKSLADLEVPVFSIEKTATKSVFQSLKKLNIGTIHLHGNRHLRNIRGGMPSGVTVEKIVDYHHQASRNLTFISCYREPISRTISYYFTHHRGFRQGFSESPQYLINYFNTHPICEDMHTESLEFLAKAASLKQNL